MSYVLNPSDGGDEYSLKAGAKTGSSVPIQLDAAVGADTEVKLTEGSNITLTQVGSDEISIAASGGGGSPGGSNGQVQYNDGGSFGGNAVFTFDDTAGAQQVVVEGSSSTDLVRITQTGSGDALVVEDETNPDSTKFKVTQNGDVTIGTSQEFLGKFRVSGVSGNRNITDPSGQANIITRLEGPSSAVELMNFNTESGNLLIYNPYVDGEYTFMRRDGVSNNIETSFVVTTEDTIKLGLGGKNYGTAGQVLTSGGPNAAASWTTVSGGGGGMVPPGIPSGNTDTGDETMGFMNGLLAANTNSPSTQQWSNTFTRVRPHVFSRTAAISSVRMAANSGPSGGVSQVVTFGLYNSNSNGQPTTLKCKATIQVPNGSGSAVYTASWVAETGQDLNVTAGEIYWCGFFSSYGSAATASNFYFANGVQLSPIFIDMDSTPQFIQTTYANSLFPSTFPSLQANPGDNGGNTWLLWQVVY